MLNPEPRFFSPALASKLKLRVDLDQLYQCMPTAQRAQIASAIILVGVWHCQKIFGLRKTRAVLYNHPGVYWRWIGATRDALR